jgi:glycosyltransferase involved in cell wall biosynthesis
MHILILPSWYKTLEQPMRGSFFRDLALSMRKNGHQVGLLIPPSKFRSFHGLNEFTKNFKKFSPKPFLLRDDGINAVKIPWWGWGPSFFQQKRVEIALNAFIKYRSYYGCPDILHAQSTLYGGFLAAEIGKIFRIPVIITEHSSAFLPPLMLLPGQKKFVKKAIAGADRILAVSPYLANSLNNIVSKTEISVVPNMIDSSFFTMSNERLPFSPFVFIAIGALRPVKGFDLLISSFANAFRDSNAKLLIAGEGPLRNRLNRKIKNLKIGKKAQLLGQLNKKQILKLIQNSHVLVSSSQKETFGITLIEAMACGKPVIGMQRSGGAESIIKHSDGILVKNGNKEDLTKAMIEIKKTYAQYDSKKIRKNCIQRFGEEIVLDQLTKIYSEAINGVRKIDSEQ